LGGPKKGGVDARFFPGRGLEGREGWGGGSPPPPSGGCYWL